MIWFWVILVCVIAFILILLSKITVSINYIHSADNDSLKIEVRLWRFIRVKKEIPLVAVDKEELSIKTKEKTEIGNEPSNKKEKTYTSKQIINNIKNISELIDKVVHFHAIVKRFLAKVSIHKLLWDSHIGTTDASLTGVLTGVAWTVKGGVIGVVSNYMKLKTNPKIYVTPYFQQMASQTRIECMISFRIGQAIYAFLQIARYLKGDLKLSKRTAH